MLVFFKFIYFLYYVHWCCARMYACVKMSDLGVNDSCDLSCGCCELSLGPLGEQPLFFFFWGGDKQGISGGETSGF